MIVTISFLIRRKTNLELEQLSEVMHWCDDRLGRADVYNTWDVRFYDGKEPGIDADDEFALIKFYDERIAAWFTLRFPDIITLTDYEDRMRRANQAMW